MHKFPGNKMPATTAVNLMGRGKEGSVRWHEKLLATCRLDGSSILVLFKGKKDG